MIRTRFAPTPSGYLHVGNAASFVLTWLLARSVKGTILLRIDDLDGDRVRPEYIEDIFRTIDFLKLDYDEGPIGPDDFQISWSQFKRIEQYEALLSKFTQRHNKAFACTCSRSKLPEGPYPEICTNKGIPLTQTDAAWRLNVTDSDVIEFTDLFSGQQRVSLSHSTGSFVVRSRNGMPAYQIVSFADDLLYNVNLIVRGSDLITSTASQLYIDSQVNSGFSAVAFVHHPLVVTADDTKLSKSNGASSVKAIRESGETPGLIYQIAAGWLGIQPIISNDIAEVQEDLLAQMQHHSLLSRLKQQVGAISNYGFLPLSLKYFRKSGL